MSTETPTDPRLQTQAAQATRSPQERWLRDRDEALRDNPWSDPSVTVMRTPDGEIVVRDRPQATGGRLSDAEYDRLTHPEKLAYSEQQAAAAATAPVDPAAKPGDPPAPQGTVVDGKLKVGDYELSPEDIAGLMERRAREDARKATMPADPSGYELKLPTDFKMPAGVEFKFNEQDPVTGPILNQARALAHELGVDQTGFSKLLSLHAAVMVNEAAMVKRASEAEVAKLGASGPVRVDAVTTFFRGMVGDRHAAALAQMLVTSRQVEAVEALMSRFTTQGGGSYSGAKREPNQPNKLSDSEYNKLTYAQQKAYAAQFTAQQERQRR